MAAPLINGEAYAWSQISVNILGVVLAGITAINYTEDQEMEENYGAGNRPVSRGFGRITTEGSITMHMTEVEALQNTVPSGRIQDIPEFDIIVAYVPANAARTVTHILKNCRFKNNGRSVSEGDMSISVELELMISDIQWK